VEGCFVVRVQDVDVGLPQELVQRFFVLLRTIPAEEPTPQLRQHHERQEYGVGPFQALPNLLDAAGEV
jgi:hypothetical protein